MLAIPEKGMGRSERSIEKHNINLDHFCDWLECCALFSGSPISKSDVIDLLVENEIYEAQDFASEIVDDAWAVLRVRFNRLLMPAGISISVNRIERAGEWRDVPAYAFCLLLCCFTYLYPDRLRELGRSINDQGDLFERLTAEALQHMLPAWVIKRVGWSPNNPVRLKDCVDTIIADLDERANDDKDLHVTSSANELGLDILAHYKFDDPDSASTVLMIQCASGANWTTKRHTPQLSIWRKIINFNAWPQKGFAIPYAFADRSRFRREATPVEGLFLDRYRLLNPTGSNRDWASEELKAALIDWCGPYIAQLPQHEVVF
jgi:hypothetical protein